MNIIKRTIFFLVPSGLVDFWQSSINGVDYYIATDSKTSFVWTLRKVIGRLECDVQKVATRLAEPSEVPTECDQGIRTVIGLWWRWPSNITPCQKERPTNPEQQNNRRRRMQVEFDFDSVFLWIHGCLGTSCRMSSIGAH